jgi:hypothetical protein
MCCILHIEDQPRWPLSLPCYRYSFIEDSLGAVNQLASTSASSLGLHQLVDFAFAKYPLGKRLLRLGFFFMKIVNLRALTGTLTKRRF